MPDFTLVDPKGWEYDLHSVYSAYMGYFQLHNIQWYDRSWGHLFSTFEEFLNFSWPTVVVTDAWTGKPHIVTRLVYINSFLKMIKTRYGEVVPVAPNMLQITPFETSTRHLRDISDYTTYKKLYSTLPAAVLAAVKTRIRAGEPKAVREIWDKRDKTFLVMDFEWSERNQKSCLEWGYAAVRCGHLDALQHWPPNPDTNYRKGHYIVADYVDKVFNKHCPTYPWHYAFGESQTISKAKLPQIIQAVICSLASPDSETTSNTFVLVGHGVSGDLQRLEEMRIKLPHNVLVIDTAVYERVLHSSGLRGVMIDPRTNNTRNPGSTLSLENMLRSFIINPPAPSLGIISTTGVVPSPNRNVVPPLVLPNVKMHNAGNDAFLCLFALQYLLDPVNTQAPTIKRGWIGHPSGMNNNAQLAVPAMPTGAVPVSGGLPSSATMPSRPRSMMLSPSYTGGQAPVFALGAYALSSLTSPNDLSTEFGQMNLRPSSPRRIDSEGMEGQVYHRKVKGGAAITA